MHKYIPSTLLLALTSLMFIGCGESTTTITQKNKVVILHDVGYTGCLLLEKFGNKKLEEQNLVINTGYSTKNNTVTCATYGKVAGFLDSYNNIDANIAECTELTFAQVQEAFPTEDLSFYENKDKSCVLSFDLK